MDHSGKQNICLTQKHLEIRCQILEKIQLKRCDERHAIALHLPGIREK